MCCTSLNLYSALNPLYLEKTGRKKSRVEATKEATGKLKDICEKKSVLWSVFDQQYGSEVKKNEIQSQLVQYIPDWNSRRGEE